MVWDILTLDYRVFFARQISDHQSDIKEVINELCNMKDPTQYGSHVACPVHNRHFLKIRNTGLVLLFTIHGDNDPNPEYRNCIELVNIIDTTKI